MRSNKHEERPKDCDRCEKYKKKLSLAKKALSFYGNNLNYKTLEEDTKVSQVQKDRGKLARETLDII